MAQTGAIAERVQAAATEGARRSVGSDALDTSIRSRYKAVRSATRALAANFSAEDQMVQSCPEANQDCSATHGSHGSGKCEAPTCRGKAPHTRESGL